MAASALVVMAVQALGTSKLHARRTVVLRASAVFAALPLAPAGALDLRKYTALAPLGNAGHFGGEKRTGLRLAELAEILKRDVTSGASGRGSYLLTGDLTPEIFRDDCRFADPTNVAEGLSRYVKALGILFEPSLSTLELLEGPTVDASDRVIRATYRSSGVLKLPWRPRITPYEAHVTWTVDDGGLIAEQAQTWSVSAFEALRETFTPGALSS